MSDQPATSSAAPNPGVAIQHAIHRAVRRDMSRLVDALGSDTTPAAATTDYASEFLFQLHHHHTFEDDAVWPLMGERLGASVEPLLERNRAEHDEIVVAVDEFTALVTNLQGDRTPARDAAKRMNDVVSTHLQHEEAEVIPLIPQAFTAEDFGRFQAESAKENPADRFLPWLLEGAPEPLAAAFTANLPEPVRELLASVWMPAWQAKVDALA